MYNTFRRIGIKWLRIPPDPEPPPGDEASARVFRASPNFLQYLRVLWAVRTLFGALFAFTFIVGAGGALILGEGGLAAVIATIGVIFALGVLLALGAISFALLQLNYENRWYIVTDRSLRIREGVTLVREITFTFANIQNLSVTQGPVQRFLGIADLKVETAGGGSGGGNSRSGATQSLHTAYFRGIDNAEEVKQLIASRMRSHRDAGLGDFDDTTTAAGPVLSPPAITEALEAVLEEARALHRAAAGPAAPAA